MPSRDLINRCVFIDNCSKEKGPYVFLNQLATTVNPPPQIQAKEECHVMIPQLIRSVEQGLLGFCNNTSCRFYEPPEKPTD